MKVYYNLHDYNPESPSVATVGTFDGVHQGHQTILRRICQLARQHDNTSVLLTFHPHPRMVLFPDDNDLKLLNTLDEKIRLLRNTGIDHLIVHPFTQAFSRTSIDDYVGEILMSKLHVHSLVIGHDHHFGRNREGNLQNLRAMAPNFGFEVEEIPAQVIDDVNISSTKIRAALHKGDVERAAEFLGYYYMVGGRVVPGNALGRSLGYPTANLQPSDDLKLVPGNGVYVVKVLHAGRVYKGMANIGVRPTVSAGLRKPALEVHMFGFNGDIYGRDIEVQFLARLRDEIKFENMEMLRNQIERDAGDVAGYFATRDIAFGVDAEAPGAGIQ